MKTFSDILLNEIDEYYKKEITKYYNQTMDGFGNLLTLLYKLNIPDKTTEIRRIKTEFVNKMSSIK